MYNFTKSLSYQGANPKKSNMNSKPRSHIVKNVDKATTSPANVQDSPLPNTNATLPASHSVPHPSDGMPGIKVEGPTVERQKRSGKDSSGGPSPFTNADSLQGPVDSQVTVYVASKPKETGYPLTLTDRTRSLEHKVGDANVYLWIRQDLAPVERWRYDEVEKLGKEATAEKEKATAEKEKAIAQRDWMIKLWVILLVAGLWFAWLPEHWSLVTSSLMPTQPQWPSQAPAVKSMVWDLFDYESWVAEIIFCGRNGERGLDEAAYMTDFGRPQQLLVESLASTKLQAKSVVGNITDGRFNGSSIQQCSHALQTTLSTYSGSRLTSLASYLPLWVARSLARQPPQPERNSLTEIHHYCQRHFRLEVARYEGSIRDISRLESAIGNTSLVVSATANATAVAAERHNLSLSTAGSSCTGPNPADFVTLDQLLRRVVPLALAQLKHYLIGRALMADRIERTAEMLFLSVGDLTDPSNVEPWTIVRGLDREVREYVRGGEEFRSQLPVMDEAYWQDR